MASPLTTRLVATVSFICLGSLQFGYHMAELNSPEQLLSCRASLPGNKPYKDTWYSQHGLVQCIPLTPEDIGVITCIFSLGGLIGSFFVGAICDSIGRKKTALGHCFIFFVGSTLNGFANSYWSLAIGRFIAGVGAGAALAIAPVFINEVAPRDIKGFLGSMNQVSVNVGILLTQILALWWCNDNQWRNLLFMGSLLLLLNLVAVALFLEELPLWLYNKGYFAQAYKVLHDIRGGEYLDAKNEVDSWAHHSSTPINTSIEEASGLLDPEAALAEQISASPGTKGISLLQYLLDPEFHNSRLISTGILIAQQFCGINSIIFYGVSVLVSVFPAYAIFINCLISILNVVVTFAAAPLVDKLGRKPLLLTSVTIMGILTVLMAFGILWTSAVLCKIGRASCGECL